MVREQLPMLDEDNLLAEPVARNTAASVAWAHVRIRKRNPNANVLISPSDQLVLNEEANWNHESMQTKEHYLEEYMAKNLYYMGCYLHQSFGVEMRPYDAAGHWWLAPGGMSVTSSSTDDEAWFWQAPPLQ